MLELGQHGAGLIEKVGQPVAAQIGFLGGAPVRTAVLEMAAAKLRDGFEQPDAMLGKLSLGRVRIFNNPDHEGGQRRDPFRHSSLPHRTLTP